MSTNSPSCPSEILDGGRYGALVPAEVLAAAILEMPPRPRDDGGLQAEVRIRSFGRIGTGMLPAA